MKRFKRLLALITMMAVLFSMSIIPSSAASKISIAIDGSQISIPATYGEAYIDSANRTQVPITAISENLGATVSWDQSTQTATINKTIKIKIGSSEIITAYGTINMDTKAVLKDNRTYVPFKYIGNALGYDVNYDAKNRVANVITKADLTISAAASLKDAMTEIKTLYLAEKPNAALTLSFGGSGALQAQIEQGADVDLFISAATSNMDKLKDESLLDDSTITNLLKNELVLVVPKDSATSISSFADVTNASITKIALGEPSTVPAGKYATQVFTNLNILDQVTAKTVYATDVKQVLNWVETGNADAGVVYLSDAKNSTNVKIVATASEELLDTPIVYPAALIKASDSPVASKDFLNFLSTASAKAIFEKWGFSVI